MVLLVYPSRGCLQGWRFHPSIDKSSQHGNVFCNSNLTILAPKKEKRKLLFCVQTQPPRTDSFIRSSPASGVIVIVNFKATGWDRPCHLTGSWMGGSPVRQHGWTPRAQCCQYRCSLPSSSTLVVLPPELCCDHDRLYVSQPSPGHGLKNTDHEHSSAVKSTNSPDRLDELPRFFTGRSVNLLYQK